MKPPLVIGIGNPTRGDDRAGLEVVRTLERLVPWGHYRSVHQLTPELAEEIAGAREVIFVDASVEARVLTIAPVDPSATPSDSHALTPGSLLGLAERIHGTLPARALAVGIPASDFGFSEELSLITSRWVREAVTRLTAHLAGDCEVAPLLL